MSMQTVFLYLHNMLYKYTLLSFFQQRIFITDCNTYLAYVDQLTKILH